MAFNYDNEVWYSMTQNQLNSIYEYICDNDLNEKLFEYIAEKQMTYEDADQLVCSMSCYPKGHSNRNFYNKGVFLFAA